MSEIPEGASIYYILPEATNLFRTKEGQHLVSKINIQMNLCFAGANKVVPVGDIFEMNNIGNALTDSEIYNKSIFDIALHGI